MRVWSSEARARRTRDQRIPTEKEFSDEPPVEEVASDAPANPPDFQAGADAEGRAESEIDDIPDLLRRPEESTGGEQQQQQQQSGDVHHSREPRGRL